MPVGVIWIMVAAASAPEPGADASAGIAMPGPSGTMPSSPRESGDEIADSTEDQVLFDRVRSGSTDAFAAFYDRHSRLFAVALRILGDVHEAEDVLQDAAVLLWEKAPGYNPAFGKPLSWAVTLTRNRAIDRLRARRRKLDLHEAAGRETASESDTADTHDALTGMSAIETAGSLRIALTALPADQRRAIELAFYSGMTQTEIALALGVPLGTIKARIRRGLMALRDSLGDNL
jgi:RNA polymerase sigma-70 factor (ECF subfamily)